MADAAEIDEFEIQRFKGIFASQCPTIWDRYGFKDDKDMIRVMAVGYKYNRDYLLAFIDHCAYCRMNNSDTWDI